MFFDIQKVIVAQVLVAPVVVGEDTGGVDHDPQIGQLPRFFIEGERAFGRAEHPQSSGVADVFGEKTDTEMFGVDDVLARFGLNRGRGP